MHAHQSHQSPYINGFKKRETTQQWEKKKKYNKPLPADAAKSLKKKVF